MYQIYRAIGSKIVKMKTCNTIDDCVRWTREHGGIHKYSVYTGKVRVI